MEFPIGLSLECLADSARARHRKTRAGGKQFYMVIQWLIVKCRQPFPAPEGGLFQPSEEGGPGRNRARD
jgi:hypothetical protein